MLFNQIIRNFWFNRLPTTALMSNRSIAVVKIHLHLQLLLCLCFPDLAGSFRCLELDPVLVAKPVRKQSQ